MVAVCSPGTTTSVCRKGFVSVLLPEAWASLGGPFGQYSRCSQLMRNGAMPRLEWPQLWNPVVGTWEGASWCLSSQMQTFFCFYPCAINYCRLPTHHLNGILKSQFTLPQHLATVGLGTGNFLVTLYVILPTSFCLVKCRVCLSTPTPIHTSRLSWPCCAVDLFFF